MRPGAPAFIRSVLALVLLVPFVLVAPGAHAGGPSDATAALASAFEARLASVPDPGTKADAADRKALVKGGAALAGTPTDLAAACGQAKKGAQAVAKALAGDPVVDQALDTAAVTLADVAATERDAYANAALESLSPAVARKALKTYVGVNALLAKAADPGAAATKRMALIGKAAKKLAAGRRALDKAAGGPPVTGIGLAVSGSGITFFNLETHAVIDIVSVGEDISDDVAVDPASSRNRAYVLGNTNLVTLDLRTRKVVGRDRFPLQHGTRQAVVHGDRLFATAFYSDSSNGIVFTRNLRAGTWDDLLVVGYYSRFLAVDPANGHLWLNGFGTDSVEVVDTQTGTSPTKIPAGGFPLGIALDPGTRRAFTVRNQAQPAPAGTYLVTMDMDTLSKVTDTWLGSASYGGEAVAVDTVRRRVYVANLEAPFLFAGNLAVVALDGLTVLGNVSVGQNPKDLAVDPSSGLVYVTTNQGIHVVDPAALSVVTTIAPTASFYGISLARPGSGN